MEKTEPLEQQDAGTADRETVDAVERLAAVGFPSWRAERLAKSALFGLISFEFQAF
jgi:hypothetical protein